MDITARHSPAPPILRALGAALRRATRRPDLPTPADCCAERAFLTEMIHHNPEACCSDLDLIAMESLR